MTTNLIVLGIELLTLLTAIVGFVTARKKVNEVHLLVNDRYSEMVKRVAQLITVLKNAGIDVPDIPNKEDSKNE